MYKIKYHSNGIIERYKVRLVSKCYTQIYGIDYHKIFTPIAKINTVRILLFGAVNNGWNIHQMDIKNVFLQENLEGLYMTLPPHQKKGVHNLVCRLKKFIYGLKHSPKAWYKKLSNFLISCRFTVSNADSSLFVKHKANGTTVVLVYVDDIIITGNNQIEFDCVNRDLKQRFEIKDLDKLKKFLG
jgi:Reverse transcriptase (RNA-dependent DNA polymerase)